MQREHYSYFLDMFEHPSLLNILKFKLGFKMLILVSERNVRNVESPLSD